MALNLVTMAMAIVVGDAIANELSVATETRRDYTVHRYLISYTSSILFLQFYLSA